MKPLWGLILSLAALGVCLSLVAAQLASGSQIAPLMAFFIPAGALLWIMLTLAKAADIYPRRRMIWLALVPGLASFAFFPLGITFAPLAAVIAIDAVLAATLLFDVCTLPAKAAFRLERQLQRVASLQKPHRVTLTIANQSRRGFTAIVKDDLAEELAPQPDQFTLQLAPRSRSTVHYDLHAVRRGAFELQSVYLRVRSRLGFWQRIVKHPLPAVVHVYPDMKQLAEYALLARSNRLSLLGVRRTRKIGQDNEFERLRDYTLDDNYKHIEWRSTARRGKLTVKDFQANQNQRLMFLIDCGRMMTNRAKGLSLLDHALNSMLMLSYVALTRGDAVGLICFSDDIHGFVPPKGGRQQMNRLLHASFDRFPRLVESRYDQAFRYLAQQCRRRSLVVLVTNVIDEVNSFQVQQYLGTIAGRHLPLGVLLRDRQVFDAADAPRTDDASLFRAAAAAEILTWRHQVLADLTSKGILSLDVFPDELTAPLVNRYLEVKARHLL